MANMTYAEMSEFLDDFFARLRKVRDAGQREYAQDDDNVFANFDRIGERLGLSRETVMMVYALKHVDGVTAHVRGLQSQREGVLRRVEDLIMYLLLFAASETKAEAEAEAFFAEADLNRLFSSPKTSSEADEETLKAISKAVEAERRRREEEKAAQTASNAPYGCLDAAGVHDAFESARRRRRERDARARVKREVRKRASSAECVCVWDEDDPKCPRHGQQQQQATEAAGANEGGQQLRQHSAAESAPEAANTAVACDLGDDCPICNPWEDVETPPTLADAYCGICQAFHPEPCDELHARWTPAPTGDAREVET